ISKLAETFFQEFKDVKVDESWPLIIQPAVEGISSRVKTVQGGFLEAIGKKMSRVTKLAQLNPSVLVNEQHGFFVYFTDHANAFVSTRACFGGQRRMKDDPKAPSRSYLKVEEAYGILGREPQEGETVVDLGAAPGGWSYSAAKRGAQVIAVDNGPLKGAVAQHPQITHLKEDAFKFFPAKKKTVDWLFCDMVANPFVIMDLMKKWIGSGWCNHFIVNLKFDRQDPLELLQKIHESRWSQQCSLLKIRQLYHDREEITVVGEVR
ncbi:MAG: rRNA methyltransferase, partial [Candidatus Omnitrophica bacterium]|nr:rRNA methyltransferase [Candidatus Omnitrophota bacterium]